jgi:hypothetical protein
MDDDSETSIKIYLREIMQPPLQELLGQWILQVFLHSTAHRSSAVCWIVSLIDQSAAVSK